MARILLLLIIAFVIWLIFRGFFRAQVRQRNVPAKSVEGEPMVTCARCGVNMPKSEALSEDGRFVCRDNPRCLSPS